MLQQRIRACQRVCACQLAAEYAERWRLSARGRGAQSRLVHDELEIGEVGRRLVRGATCLHASLWSVHRAAVLVAVAGDELQLRDRRLKRGELLLRP